MTIYPLNSVSEFGKKNVILERHAEEYAKRFLNELFQWQTVGLLIANYVVEGKVMDREGWKQYFDVDIGPENEQIREALAFDSFYKFYHRQNPVDSTKQICETCLIPTVVPETVTLEGKVVPFTLEVLKTLSTRRDIKWEYDYLREDIYKSGAESSHLVIRLSEVFALGMPWKDQVKCLDKLNKQTGCGFETRPKLLYQMTPYIAHIVATEGSPLKDKFMSNSQDIIYKLVPHGLDYQATFGRYDPKSRCLFVDVVSYRNKSDQSGIGVQKEFKPSKSSCTLQ